MPQILVNGELQEVTQEEFNAWTAANPGPGEVPAGGEVLQIPTQPEILVPNTSNTSPEQELQDLYEEFSVTPSTTDSGVSYYGESLTKNIQERVYSNQPLPVGQQDVLGQELVSEFPVPALDPEETPQRDPYVSSQTVLGQSLEKNVIEREPGAVNTADPGSSVITRYGAALSKEPVRARSTTSGDTLSGSGSAALIAAATIGTYAFKALSPSGTKDYYASADEADRLAINTNASAPSGLNDYYNTSEEADRIVISQPENLDDISLDTLYKDTEGAEDLGTGDIYYGEDLDLNSPYQDQDGDGVIDLDTGDELVAEPYSTSEEVQLSDAELFGEEETTGLDDPYQDNENISLTGATEPAPLTDAEIAEYQAQTAINVNETGANFQDTVVSDEAAAAESAYYQENPDAVREVINAPPPADIGTTTEEVQLSDAELFGEEQTTGLDDPYQDGADGAEDLETGEINYGDDLSLDQPFQDETDGGFTEFTADGDVRWTQEDALGLDSPYEDQGDGALDLDTGEINYGDDLSLDNPYQDTEGAQDLETGEFFTDSNSAAAAQQAQKQTAQATATLQKHKNQASQGDWRVRLRLAPGANYILTQNSGILAPVQKTGGVIFPYVPQIQTSYVATYNNYDLTHSNYRGYFYQSSHVGEINITAPFTAQDTSEAAYLLAVIHFFRTVTKMFYGQNTPGRGSPPPLVYLQGLGQYQFNLHPCVVSQFTYSLPNDVDYIRTGPPNVDGTNMLARRDKDGSATNPWDSVKKRLSNAGLDPGGIKELPAPKPLGTVNPTYVPTKMEIQLTLLPIQSRQQVSKQFNMPGYANGHLLEGGFW